MHEGHHGILDGIEEDHHQEHTHDNTPCCHSCSGEASRGVDTSGKLKRTAGLIALAGLLIILFYLISR